MFEKKLNFNLFLIVLYLSYTNQAKRLQKLFDEDVTDSEPS